MKVAAPPEAPPRPANRIELAGTAVTAALNNAAATLTVPERRELFVQLVELLRAAVAEIDEHRRRAAPPVLAEKPAAEPVAFGKGSRSSDALDQAA